MRATPSTRRLECLAGDNVILPAVAPSVFFLIVRMPVDVFGCRTRGVLAVLIALLSSLAALGAAIRGAKGRVRRELQARRWVITTLILVIPVIALLLLA